MMLYVSVIFYSLWDIKNPQMFTKNQQQYGYKITDKKDILK